MTLTESYQKKDYQGTAGILKGIRSSLKLISKRNQSYEEVGKSLVSSIYDPPGFVAPFATNIYMYTNLPVNATVRLPHPRSGDSQGQETFLAPSADKQTRNYDTELLYFIYVKCNIYIHIYVYVCIILHVNKIK